MIFPEIRQNMGCGFLAAAIVIAAIVIALWLTGCGGGGNALPCSGSVTDKFTEYEPGPGIVSGSITIPTGSTKYAIAIKREDGTFCSKRLHKSNWLAIQRGDHYG